MRPKTGVSSVVVVCLSFSAASFSSRPLFASDDGVRSVGLKPNDFLRSWLVLAPVPIAPDAATEPGEAVQKAAFGSDLLASAGGEAAVAPTAGQKVTIAGKDYEWRLLTADSDAVSFGVGPNTPAHVVAYAWAEAAVSEDTRGLLGVGSDDAVKVWVNGRSVHENWVGRALEKDADLVPVHLEKGVNRILVKEGYPGAAVLISKEGRILFRKAYGSACLEPGVPASPETKYRIGSVTKQFTAAAILKLHEQGKLGLQDELSKFIPDFPRGDSVTVHHLLTHTSGIHSYTNKPDFVTVATQAVQPEELIRSFRDDPYDFDPGQKWLYNNSGYFLLGYIVEKVSGVSYGEYLRRTFFEPLGMRNTAVHDARAVIPGEACGYAWENDRATKALNWDMSRAGAAGALYSTVDDLQVWNEALFGGKVLSKASLDAALVPVVTAEDTSESKDEGYGYGLGIFRTRGLRVVAHGGGLSGFQSNLLRVPDERFTVVVLSNSAPNVPGLLPGALSNEIAELYLNEKMQQRVAPSVDKSVSSSSYDDYVGQYDYGGAIDPKVYDAYVGKYDYGQGKAIMTISREGDRLFAQLTGQPKLEIFPKSESVFFWKAVQAEIAFVNDSAGKVTKAAHTQGGRTFEAPRIE